MKKDKRLFIASLIFYLTAGLAACVFLLLDSVPTSTGNTEFPYVNDLSAELEEPLPEETLPEEQTSEELPPEELPQEESPAPEQTVEEEPAEDIAETPEPEPEAPTYSYVTTNTIALLNLREAPNTNSNILYRLEPGSTGDVLEIGEEWSKIQFGDLVGYVTNEYLEIQEIQ